MPGCTIRDSAMWWWWATPQAVGSPTKAALASAASQYLGRHDARRYGERVASADGDVEVHTWEGMPHVFPTNVGVLHAGSSSPRIYHSVTRCSGGRYILSPSLTPKAS
jgi:acetyl esterase